MSSNEYRNAIAQETRFQAWKRARTIEIAYYSIPNIVKAFNRQLNQEQRSIQQIKAYLNEITRQ